MQNTFKNNQEPKREVQRTPLKLKPPVFEDITEEIRAKQPKINRLFMSIIKVL